MDPEVVGRSGDRRWIQRSSADPVIVGRSRDRRWIQMSENPESVGSPSAPRGLVVDSSRRFNSLKFSLEMRSSAAEHHYALCADEISLIYRRTGPSLWVDGQVHLVGVFSIIMDSRRNGLRCSALQYAFSRDFTVLPAHPAFIR